MRDESHKNKGSLMALIVVFILLLIILGYLFINKKTINNGTTDKVNTNLIPLNNNKYYDYYDVQSLTNYYKEFEFSKKIFS